MKFTTYLYLAIIIFTSCKGEESIYIEKKIRECVLDNTNSYIYDYFGENSTLNVYTIAELSEKEFILNGLLLNNQKDSYIDFIKNLFENKTKTFDDIKTKKTDIDDFISIARVVVLEIINNCPQKVVIQEKNEMNSSLVNQLSIASELLSTGFEDINLLTEYIKEVDSTDFKKIE